MGVRGGGVSGRAFSYVYVCFSGGYVLDWSQEGAVDDTDAVSKSRESGRAFIAAAMYSFSRSEGWEDAESERGRAPPKPGSYGGV